MRSKRNASVPPFTSDKSLERVYETYRYLYAYSDITNEDTQRATVNVASRILRGRA